MEMSRAGGPSSWRPQSEKTAWHKGHGALAWPATKVLWFLLSCSVIVQGTPSGVQLEPKLNLGRTNEGL